MFEKSGIFHGYDGMDERRRDIGQRRQDPSFDKELAIVRKHVPGAAAKLAAQVTSIVQELRTAELYKVPGVSETIDWLSALVALDREALDPVSLDETIGVVLKAREDVEALRGRRATELLEHANTRV